MSTSSSVVACSSSARASAIVRLGRLISSENSRPLAKLVMPKRWMKIVLGPIAVADAVLQRRIESADQRRHRHDRRDADHDAQHGEAGAQLVRAHGIEGHDDDLAEQPERILRRFHSRLSASIGSSRAAREAGYSPKNRPTSAVMPMPSATDHSWIDAGIGVNREIVIADHGAEDRSDDAAEHRQHDGLGEHLRHDVGAPRAERFSQSDLARALGDDHQHDVHDDDAADDERQRDDADQHGKDAARRRSIDAEHRVGIEDREVVRLARLQPPRDPQRHRRVVDGRARSASRSRGFTDIVSCRRDAEHLLKLSERDRSRTRPASGRAAIRASR